VLLNCYDIVIIDSTHKILNKRQLIVALLTQKKTKFIEFIEFSRSIEYKTIKTGKELRNWCYNVAKRSEKRNKTAQIAFQYREI
jgi:hypothetical protein